MDPARKKDHDFRMNDDPGPPAPMIHRARHVATGLADVGLTHAEDLLRSLSPEGREQARRERAAKARRQKRLMIRLVFAAVASMLAWAMLDLMLPSAIALVLSVAVMLVLTMLIVLRAPPRVPGREALAGAPLARLAEEASVWLAAQRRGMPMPALRLADELSRRLDDVAPRLGALDPRSPAAASLRTLVAVELPALVEGWRTVPIAARRQPHADGRTPDDHLVNGLRLIDAELARAHAQLGQGALDGIAVQGRYLELKYDEGGRPL